MIDIREIFRNPAMLILCLPFLPFILIASMMQPVPLQTKNVEEWVIYEDPETGEIRIRVYRDVKRT
jgi:hypothetical protein